ncbi:hypothetical protein NP493_354g03053 [Ridgeia piscesae]|uniref:Uncharacterized protein n=1 Tax=Ridgeia piscesae TaxID=27915 RepID=A0AAD9L414_RIDPI|nr:hypothetical protein NP493_354g03053 [Ridgeia piscesae]
MTDIQSGGGVWVVKLTATPPGGPYVVKATVETQSIEMKDVLFGDVWLCGGQSNMQFGLEYIFNASEELASAKNYPHIRLFDAKMIASPVPLADLQAITLQWSLPSNVDGNWTAAPVVNVGASTVQLSWRACGADIYVMGLRYEWRLTPMRL